MLLCVLSVRGTDWLKALLSESGLLRLLWASIVGSVHIGSLCR